MTDSGIVRLEKASIVRVIQRSQTLTANILPEGYAHSKMKTVQICSHQEDLSRPLVLQVNEPLHSKPGYQIFNALGRSSPS